MQAFTAGQEGSLAEGVLLPAVSLNVLGTSNFLGNDQPLTSYKPTHSNVNTYKLPSSSPAGDITQITLDYRDVSLLCHCTLMKNVAVISPFKVLAKTGQRLPGSKLIKLT